MYMWHTHERREIMQTKKEFEIKLLELEKKILDIFAPVVNNVQEKFYPVAVEGFNER